MPSGRKGKKQPAYTMAEGLSVYTILISVQYPGNPGGRVEEWQQTQSSAMASMLEVRDFKKEANEQVL